MGVMMRLLHAYAAETGRPSSWAEGIIRDWFQSLGNATEGDGDELENHILTLLDLYEAILEKSQQAEISPQQRTLVGCFQRQQNYSIAGEIGTLYMTTSGKLLNAMNLNRIGSNTLPKTAQAMGRRLEHSNWSTLRVLNESDDSRLKRQSKQRPIGVFRPSESSMTNGGSEIQPVHAGLLIPSDPQVILSL